MAVGGRHTPRSVLLRNRVRNGKDGYDVLTPLLLEQGTGVVVDRGWVAVNPVEKWFWQAVSGLSARGEPPLTEYAYAEVA